MELNQRVQKHTRDPDFDWFQSHVSVKSLNKISGSKSKEYCRGEKLAEGSAGYVGTPGFCSLRY